jgi:hypothetical protein
MSAISARTLSAISIAFDPGAWRSGDLPVPPSLDDDVAELFLIMKAPLGIDRQLKIDPRQARRSADHAGGRLHVLCADLVDNVVRRETALGDLLRVQPDAH